MSLIAALRISPSERVMKYVCLMNDETKKEEIFTFPNNINHDAFAMGICRLKNHLHGNWRRIRRDVISAGFVDASFNCFGRSETLRLDSRGEVDSLLLSEQIRQISDNSYS